jgi:hypothetical protein
MKKLLILFTILMSFSSYAGTMVITCNTESVTVDSNLGKRTEFPGSTDTITMILEYINKEPIAEITSITTKKLVGGQWSDGEKWNITTKFKILKQNDEVLTAINEDVSSYSSKILFLNKKNGAYTSSYVGPNEASGTIGKCYK